MPRGRSNLHSSRYKRLLTLLVRARVEAEFTQVEVSHRLKKPQSRISKSERGERRIDPTELEDLAELYGKDLSYFRTRRQARRLRSL